jgi:hypothetical protein
MEQEAFLMMMMMNLTRFHENKTFTEISRFTSFAISDIKKPNFFTIGPVVFAPPT